MSTTDTLDTAGTTIVANWLRQKGYNVDLAFDRPGSTEIVVRGTPGKLLILVTSSGRDGEQHSAVYERVREAKLHAVRQECEPFEALVMLDEEHRQVGPIQLKRL